jgi:hypothetical protein
MKKCKFLVAGREGLALRLITVPTFADPNTLGLVFQNLTQLLIMTGAYVTFRRRSIASAFSGVWRGLPGQCDA